MPKASSHAFLIVRDCDMRLRCDGERYLDEDLIAAALRRRGHQVTWSDYSSLINHRQLNQHRRLLVLYSSTQFPEYKALVEDVVLCLSHHNTLLPDYELLRAQDNPALQELLKQRHNIPGPVRHIVATKKDLDRLSHRLQYPVFVQPFGAPSQPITRATSPKALNAMATRRSSRRRPQDRLVEVWRSHIALKGDDAQEYANRTRNARTSRRMIVHAEHPRQGVRWRITLFGQLAFAHTMGSDRAPIDSRGAHDDHAADTSRVAPEHILALAHEWATRLQMPFGLLDINERGGHAELLNFQALHFNVDGVINAQRHHRRTRDGRWQTLDGTLSVEACYVEAICTAAARSATGAP